MTQSLGPIPEGVAIVNEDRSITDFFRLRWQDLITAFTTTPTVATVQQLAQGASIATVAAYTTLSPGKYRVSYYLRKTTADGAGSALTFTWGWTETGIPLTESAAALLTDTTAAEQSGSKVVYADGATDLTFAVVYASTTPLFMKFRVDVVVEKLA